MADRYANLIEDHPDDDDDENNLPGDDEEEEEIEEGDSEEEEEAEEGDYEEEEEIEEGDDEEEEEVEEGDSEEEEETEEEENEAEEEPEEEPVFVKRSENKTAADRFLKPQTPPVTTGSGRSTPNLETKSEGNRPSRPTNGAVYGIASEPNAVRPDTNSGQKSAAAVSPRETRNDHANSQRKNDELLEEWGEEDDSRRSVSLLRQWIAPIGRLIPKKKNPYADESSDISPSSAGEPTDSALHDGETESRGWLARLFNAVTSKPKRLLSVFHRKREENETDANAAKEETETPRATVSAKKHHADSPRSSSENAETQEKLSHDWREIAKKTGGVTAGFSTILVIGYAAFVFLSPEHKEKLVQKVEKELQQLDQDKTSKPLFPSKEAPARPQAGPPSDSETTNVLPDPENEENLLERLSNTAKKETAGALDKIGRDASDALRETVQKTEDEAQNVIHQLGDQAHDTVQAAADKVTGKIDDMANNLSDLTSPDFPADSPPSKPETPPTSTPNAETIPQPPKPEEVGGHGPAPSFTFPSDAEPVLDASATTSDLTSEAQPESPVPAAISTPPAAISTPPAAISTPPAAISTPPAAISTPPTAISTPPTALSDLAPIVSNPGGQNPTPVPQAAGPVDVARSRGGELSVDLPNPTASTEKAADSLNQQMEGFSRDLEVGHSAQEEADHLTTSIPNDLRNSLDNTPSPNSPTVDSRSAVPNANVTAETDARRAPLSLTAPDGTPPTTSTLPTADSVTPSGTQLSLNSPQSASPSAAPSPVSVPTTTTSLTDPTASPTQPVATNSLGLPQSNFSGELSPLGNYSRSGETVETPATGLSQGGQDGLAAPSGSPLMASGQPSSVAFSDSATSATGLSSPQGGVGTSQAVSGTASLLDQLPTVAAPASSGTAVNPLSAAAATTLSVNQTTVPGTSLGTTAVNTPTPAVAAVQNSANNVAASSRQYQSRNGDNLLSIAENELGDITRWSEIKRLNPDKDLTGNIPAGTTIRLP